MADLLSMLMDLFSAEDPPEVLAAVSSRACR